MKKIFSLLVGAFLVYSCTPKEEELGTPFQAGQQVMLKANMPGRNSNANWLPSKQQVSGVYAGTHVNLVWDEDDEVLVKVDRKTAKFKLESGAGSTIGTFMGIMPASGTTYSVQYPVSEPDLSNQIYVENGFGKGLMKMTAEGTLYGGFTFVARHALLGLQLTGEEALGNIVLTNPVNSKTYTLNCAGVTLTNVEKFFYFVVPAQTWARGFTVDVYAPDNTKKIKTLTTSSRVVFTAGKAVVPSVQEVISPPVHGIGVFSVSADKLVTFSPGNLQFHPMNNKWRFAEHQYDYIGNANANISAIYDGWLDLFGWSTNATNFGVISSENPNDYLGDFVDWGINKIGVEVPESWQTLTSDEWNYVLNARPNASSLCGVAQVNGVNGLILLPDYWSCPVGVTFISGFASTYNHQNITAEDWAKLEEAGAVFLPGALSRQGTDVRE